MMMTGILFAAFIAVNAEVPIGTNGVSDTARFVKTFECRDAKDVRRATWTVTGLGVFRAYVNGVEVGADDHLKPGLTHILKRRHSFAYDITGLLRSGKNVLAAEVSTGWWRDGVVCSPGVEPTKEIQGRGPKKSRNLIAVLCCFCGWIDFCVLCGFGMELRATGTLPLLVLRWN